MTDKQENRTKDIMVEQMTERQMTDRQTDRDRHASLLH